MIEITLKILSLRNFKENTKVCLNLPLFTSIEVYLVRDKDFHSQKPQNALCDYIKII